jgi:hypothetical protein
MKRMFAFVFTVVFLISSATCRESAPLSNEDGNISCEVKLLLNSDLVLDEDGLLSETVLEKLMLDREYGNYEAAFLDTADRTYLSTGWVNRIHMKEGKKKYTVRFKKRIKVNGQDLERALAAAGAGADSVSMMQQLMTAVAGIENGSGGDITIPVYIGQDRIDEIVVTAAQRANYRSGGR